MDDIPVSLRIRINLRHHKPQLTINTPMVSVFHVKDLHKSLHTAVLSQLLHSLGHTLRLLLHQDRLLIAQHIRMPRAKLNRSMVDHHRQLNHSMPTSLLD
jgi:hypothetical protein